MTSRHVLITGGAGFIGTHLCAVLLDRGDRVTALDDLSAGRLPAVDDLLTVDGFTLLRHDVTEPFLVSDRVDAVVHMATPNGPDAIRKRPIDTLRANSVGAINALEVARHHGARFVLVSTGDVYGDPLVHPQHETYRGNVDPGGPFSAYTEGKRFAEAAVTAYVSQHGLNAGVVRPANIYGPGMGATPGVVGTFITKALAGQTLKLQGGTQTRTFCYVDDFVSGLVAMIDTTEIGPINLGTTEEISIAELAELIVKTVGTGAIEITPGRDQDSARRCPDITRADELLGWKPQMPLAEGIERTVAWARAAHTG
ncbi:NAD-dependent epimerase/dehydratase family protein [Streptosporangium lutulentum]|uniref:Nucleoside-diphosphate-sugar epimerase n=1 Tax=Streptosporangium lutulentum TaxID=1461250 RepID=A0ABT9QA04_9ACTN|nr:NAD-dependent epimerase/dehydratase family protein [Streptosporangium lutulentum]MDP9843230.1 nucleoside-diphosphate-sugar epimerase [Streptosporangium lutulentum]